MLAPEQFLKKAAELGRIPHALLFYGQDSEEKMATALEFVKLVNGPDALNGVRPDLVVIEPEEDKEIKIAQIRDVNNITLSSYQAIKSFNKICHHKSILRCTKNFW